MNSEHDVAAYVLLLMIHTGKTVSQDQQINPSTPHLSTPRIPTKSTRPYIAFHANFEGEDGIAGITDRPVSS